MTTHWATTEPADCEPAWDEQRRVDVVNLPDISEWNEPPANGVEPEASAPQPPNTR